MAIEYPVKIKFNYDSSQIKKVQKDVNAQVGKADKESSRRKSRGAGTRAGILGGVGAGEIMGDSKGGGGKGGKGGGLKTLGKIAGTLGIIAGLMKVFQPFIELIFNLLQYYAFKMIDTFKFLSGKGRKEYENLPEGMQKKNLDPKVNFAKEIADRIIGAFKGDDKNKDKGLNKDAIPKHPTELARILGIGGDYNAGDNQNKDKEKDRINKDYFDTRSKLDKIGDYNKGPEVEKKGIFKRVADSFMEFFKNMFKGIDKINVWLWEEVFKPAFKGIMGAGEKIWKDIIKPSLEGVGELGKKIWNKVVDAFEGLKGIGEAIWGWIKSLIPGKSDSGGGSDFSKKDISNNPNDSSGTGGLNEDALDTRTPLEKIKDAATPGFAFGGKATSDGLYKLHAGEQVSRGNTTNSGQMDPTININIIGSSSVDDDTINEISQRITDELRSFERF